MIWDAADVISLAALVGAAACLIGYMNRVFMWMYKNTHQQEDLKAVKEKQRVLCVAVSACLDGLIQLGANHEVPKAKKALDDYIREQAHK